MSLALCSWLLAALFTSSDKPAAEPEFLDPFRRLFRNDCTLTRSTVRGDYVSPLSSLPVAAVCGDATSVHGAHELDYIFHGAHEFTGALNMMREDGGEEAFYFDGDERAMFRPINAPISTFRFARDVELVAGSKLESVFLDFRSKVEKSASVEYCWQVRVLVSVRTLVVVGGDTWESGPWATDYDIEPQAELIACPSET